MSEKPEGIQTIGELEHGDDLQIILTRRSILICADTGHQITIEPSDAEWVAQSLMDAYAEWMKKS